MKLQNGSRNLITNDLIINQHERLSGVHRDIVCPCGDRIRLIDAYRCLYCDGYFCLKCMEEHLGKTQLERIKERRAELRAKIKNDKITEATK